MASNFPFISRLGKSEDKPDLTFKVNNNPPEEIIWDEITPIYSSMLKNEEGSSLAYLYRIEECDILRFTGTSDYYIYNNCIVCHLLKEEKYPLIEIQLLGSVFSYWLERQGIPAIHASVSNIEGYGIGFLSSNKGGKTSIAASLMQMGYPLVTDDIMAVDHENQIYCRPGYPTMRMWPEVAKHFLGHFEDLPLVLPELSKRRVFVGPDSFGEFYNKKVPLKCLYIPERIEGVESKEVEIEKLSQGDGLIELVKHSFIGNLAHSVGWQPKRLEVFAEIVRKIPVRRIIYPSGYQNLEKVCNAIIENFKE